MVDFHSHFLPAIDDGSEDVDMSLDMLQESYRQGVRLMCATPHFYADEDDPARFLARRDDAYRRLLDAMSDGENYPELRLGAEVLYFPGISVADEVRELALQDSPFLLIEPPMMPWPESMLDEIEQCGYTLRCVPVIAHIDRYIRFLHDRTLFDRVKDRRLLIQVNASFFLHRDLVDMAMMSLRRERFQFIGSDCHDTDERRPNLGYASEAIHYAGLDEAFNRINRQVYEALKI